jgi:divalent metal cation (Fe/Co/Zn/Cd) transporter
MGKKMSKRITFISAIITFISFLYKGFLGYLSKSIIIAATALSSLSVFFCKIIYVKKLTKSRREKRHAYLLMGLILLVYGALFLFVVISKLKGLYDIEEKVYKEWQSILLSLVIVLMMVLSIRGYKVAQDRTDIMVLGLKEVGLATALSDLIVLEGLLDDFAIGHIKEDYLNKFHYYLSLGVSGLIIIISFVMIIRFFKRTRDEKKNL